jgi:YjbE family integral membrane protein
MLDQLSPLLIPLLQIVWIDILLSGDNAVVIALACRNLPDEQRRWGVILGAGAAVGLRILFMLIVAQLLAVPYLKMFGGVLLFYIAIKLALGDDDHKSVAAKTTLWGAVTTIAIADGAMSLDNVLAIAAASKGHDGLMIFGVLLSIPLVVFGAKFVMAIIERWPILVWAGAALLGWIAGEMIATDAMFDKHFAMIADVLIKIAGAAIVVIVAFAFRQRAARAA